MGACSIEETIEGKKTFSEIKRIFRNAQQRDESVNGSRDGYSGDFQTVDIVEDHTHKIFDSYGEAENYCLENAQKWETVIAVYYKVVADNNKKMNDFVKEMRKLRLEFEDLGVNVSKSFLSTKSRSSTCKKCTSRINKDYLRLTFCPVCRNTLLPESIISRMENKKNIFDKKNESIQEKIATEQRKLAAKSKNVNTLIAGWGAS